MQETRSKIVIDTDAGHDDALAMMLLIKSNLLDISAVTTVAGNSTIDKVTRNAQAVLDLIQADAIPLYSGAELPLKRELITAVVHGESGLDGLDMSQTKYELTENAVEKMADLIAQHPNEVTILTLGPLTNVARLFEKNPELIPLIREVVIMGGAIDVPGNKNRVAEFNVFVDPEAADIVLRAPVKKILVPLDPCNDIVLSIDTFEPLRGTSLFEPLNSMMAHFISGIESDEGVAGALVYDALAAYYLLNKDAYTLKAMDVKVETKGEHTFGMTVAEKRKNKPVELNVDVVTSIDREAFVGDLLTYLGK